MQLIEHKIKSATDIMYRAALNPPGKGMAKLMTNDNGNNDSIDFLTKKRLNS